MTEVIPHTSFLQSFLPINAHDLSLFYPTRGQTSWAGSFRGKQRGSVGTGSPMIHLAPLRAQAWSSDTLVVQCCQVCTGILRYEHYDKDVTITGRPAPIYYNGHLTIVSRQPFDRAPPLQEAYPPRQVLRGYPARLQWRSERLPTTGRSSPCMPWWTPTEGS